MRLYNTIANSKTAFSEVFSMNTNDNRFDSTQNENSHADPVSQRAEDTQEPMNEGPNSTNNSENITDTPTYGQVYTPGESGYSVKPTGQGNGYSPSSYSAPYTPNSSQASQGNTASRTDVSAKAQKRSNIAMVAIICCCIVAALTVIGCVSIALFDRLTQSYGGDDTQWSGSNLTPGTGDSESVNGSGDAGDQSNEAPSVSKNPGTKQDVSGGKIGELMTMAEAVALIKDSVVEISTEKKATGSFFSQYITGGAGSGVIVAKEGYIITNNHVIESASNIKISLTNGHKYDAKLIGTDPTTDIAVLKIEPTEELTVAVLGSSESLVLAQDVIVIGNPLGSLGGTVTGGIISALDRQITVEGESMTLLQTDTAVNPGNSGGGMFNLRGELVGIVNAKSTGEDVEGLGFAIPIDTAYTVFNQLVEFGYVRGRVDHGLNLVDITDFFSASAYRVNTLGVYVYESKYSNEIKNGDRIVSFNGTEVMTSAEVKSAIADCEVGDTVKVVLARGGKTVEVNLTLREYNPSENNAVRFE